MPTVADLAAAQLAAYNAADLDAFCACYADDVTVLDAAGAVTCQGMEAFRERYRPMFERGNFGASVSTRLHLGDHAMDDEEYWRVGPDGARTEGRVLVRYTAHGDTIGVVQFFR